MIEAIREINFPSYATLSKATVALNDMGDRTITTEVKIDGDVTPDFSFDWEIEFKGERYIQPLRKPQALKDNNSLKSTINLTFYHWAIYQLKRDFFVELASTQAGTAFADKYVAPLAVNLKEFVTAFNNVLSYYFPDGKIYADLNPAWQYDAEKQYVDINYSYLWDVLQKTYEMFGARWAIERDENGNYAVRFGYPTGELSHVFEYGFEGGLLKVERQVQDSNIRNKILGRGGSQNIPYLYFKDFDKYPQGGDGNQGMTPDPDAIPELSNIYFSELRDSNFRSYVQGWKTNSNRQLVEGDILDELDAERAETDYAYMRGATDEKFDPVEYVKDDESIAEYGELVGKLENNEEIYPSLQGMEIEIASPLGNKFTTRADEIVAVQEVVTDRLASDEEDAYKNDIKKEMKSSTEHGAGANTFVATAATISVSSNEIDVPEGYEGTLFDIPIVKYTLEWKERIKQYMQYEQYYEGDRLNGNQYQKESSYYPQISYKVIDAISNEEVHPANLPEGRYRIDYTFDFPEVTLARGYIHAQQTPSGLGQTERVGVYWLKRIITTSATMVCKSFNGDVILNKVDGVSISKSISVEANSKATISISGDAFSVPEQGAIMVDVPISITPASTTTYSEKTVKVVNASTNEIVPATNIPKGEYKLLVDVTLTNESSSQKTLKVELLPAYLYFVDNTVKWEPTFDVWIKNIFNTKKSNYASEAAYVEGVWSPLRTEDEMALTFSSGNLSGHDNWEFRVKKDGIAYDNSKVIIDANGNEVRSEWRLTLIKSDAELETIKKYIPYKDFNATAGDKFFFTGIYLPHQYVLSAEQKLTRHKQDNLLEVKDIKPQWVVSIDKVRAQQGGAAERLIDKLSVGSVITLRDKRFLKNASEIQTIQSITYEWQEGLILPNVDVVLSDKITTTLSTVAMLQGKVESLIKQTKSLSDIEAIVRKLGDMLYLRKDGFEDTSYSPTKFADTVSSEDFNPGAVGGFGWGIYQDENGQSVIEADKLFIRNELQVNSFVVNQIAALGGTKILSAADMTVSSVEPVVLENNVVGERCFFDTKGASKANLFAVDDIAYSNMFDSGNAELKYYKRRVIEVGENYITLSTNESDGSGTPQEGDVIVQLGNFTDKTRQSFIIIDPLNGGKIDVFSGVNSFSLSERNMIGLGTNPETNESFLYGYGDMFFGERSGLGSYISFDKSTGKLSIKAEVKFEAGTSGIENIEGLSETIASAVSGIDVGGQNMLRNSGFTGDYLSEPLADQTVMDATKELYSDPLDHWFSDAYPKDNATVRDSETSASGKELVLSGGSVTQELFQRTVEGETYVLSFKAKGNVLTYTFGDTTKRVELSDNWEKYVEKIVVSSNSNIFSITNADCVLCEIQLERGTIATSWGISPLDNSSDRAYYQSMKYISDSIVNEALTEGATDILGGLILTNHIKVGNYADNEMIQETAGVNGKWTSDESVAFWSGGDLVAAITTANKFKDNPSYQPTAQELKSMANFVATHGGRIIANDAIIRGTIYAQDGEFTGDINANGGSIGRLKITVNPQTKATTLSSATEYCSKGFMESASLTDGNFGASTSYNDKEGVCNQPYSSAIDGVGLHCRKQYKQDSLETFLDDENWKRGSADIFIEHGDSFDGSETAFRVNSGLFMGLRPYVLVADSDVLLSAYDHTIIVETSGITLYLPENPKVGQRYEIFKPYSNSVKISSQGVQVYSSGSYGGNNGYGTNVTTIGGSAFVRAVYIYTGSYWFRTIENYD